MEQGKLSSDSRNQYWNIPGLGGTQRPARIAGLPAARWAVLAGNFMDAKTAADLGLVTDLVDVTEVDSTIASLDAKGKPAEKYPATPVNPESKIASLLTHSTVMTIWTHSSMEVAQMDLTLRTN